MENRVTRADVVRPDRLPVLETELWSSAEVLDAAVRGEVGPIVELARRAHGLSRSRLGELAGLSKRAVGRIEVGGAPDVRVVRALQRVLGIPAHLLGLADQAVVIRPGPAQQLLGDAPADVPVAVDGPTLLSLLPLDPTSTEDLLVVRRVVNDVDNYGRPTALRPTVRDLLDFTDRLRRSASGDFRRQLLGVGALYAEFYGWLYEETDDLHSARYWTTQALQQAQSADEPDAIAYAYVRMAHLAALEEDPDRVMGLVRAARHTVGVSPALQAVVLRQEAIALASSGDWSCLDRLDQALVLIGQREQRVTNEYELGYCFTEHQVDVQRAACFLELGCSDDAIEQYEQLRSGDLCLGDRGMHTAKLALAYALSGDLSAAAACAMEALGVARATRSAAITRELRKLEPWNDDQRVAEVTRHLCEV
jgi:transcriptional regulator with XRE-family HTH domain